jgi:hypothetical protein
MTLRKLLSQPGVLLVFGFGVLSLAAMLAIRVLAPDTSLPAAPAATVGPLHAVTVGPWELTLNVPTTWPSAAIRDARSFVLSPTGSPDTSSTAGVFLYVVTDALKVFGEQLNFRADLSDPQAQLQILLDSLNRDRPRFKVAQPYPGLQYPAAMVRGYEQGNELTILLMNAGPRGWIYIGAQAPDRQFEYYETAVFRPASESLTFR